MGLFIFTNVFLSISCLLLFDWVGLGINALGILRQIVFVILLIKHDKIPQWVSVCSLLFFLISAVVIMVFVWTSWYSWLILATQLFLIYGCWCKSDHIMRISNFIIAAVIMPHYLWTGNYVVIAIEVAVIISIVIFYLRVYIDKHGKRNQQTKSCDIRIGEHRAPGQNV